MNNVYIYYYSTCDIILNEKLKKYECIIKQDVKQRMHELLSKILICVFIHYELS